VDENVKEGCYMIPQKWQEVHYLLREAPLKSYYKDILTTRIVHKVVGADNVNDMKLYMKFG